MDFDLRLLRHARALAEAGSFARAARALHLTQPALSHSIRTLEQRVGTPLFVRGRGGIEPTDHGRLFLVRARDVLASAEALGREVALMRGAASGELRVGAGTYVSALFLDAAIAGFVAGNPGVGLRVMHDAGVDLMHRLRAGDLDVAVGARPDDTDAIGLDIAPLGPRTARLLVRAGHPWLARGAVDLDEALTLPLVCPTRVPAPLNARILGARGPGARPVPDFACESAALMRAVTLAADHALLGTLAMFADDVEAGRLVPLPVTGEPFVQQFAVARRAGATGIGAVDALVAAIVSADRAGTRTERRLAARTDPAAARPAR